MRDLGPADGEHGAAPCADESWRQLDGRQGAARSSFPGWPGCAHLHQEGCLAVLPTSQHHVHHTLSPREVLLQIQKPVQVRPGNLHLDGTPTAIFRGIRALITRGPWWNWGGAEAGAWCAPGAVSDVGKPIDQLVHGDDGRLVLISKIVEWGEHGGEKSVIQRLSPCATGLLSLADGLGALPRVWAALTVRRLSVREHRVWRGVRVPR